MASILAGALVRFRVGELVLLRFPPPCAEVGIAVTRRLARAAEPPDARRLRRWRGLPAVGGRGG